MDAAAAMPAVWRCVDLGDQSRRDTWIAEAQALWDELENPHLAQHPSRLHTDHGKVVVVEQRSGGTLLVYVLLELRKDAIPIRLGGFRVPGMGVSQAEVIGGIVGKPDRSESVWAAIADALPEALSGTLIGLKFSPLAAVAAEVAANTRPPGRFRLFRLGRPQRHYASDLASSYQGYLAALPPRYRQELRRVTRNLEKRFGDSVRFREYSSVDEVTLFLDDAVPISAKTPQSRLFKVGISEHHLERKKQYEELAARGAWFAHILFCDAMPVAFLAGCRLGRVFYGMETGYRPEWASHSVGRVAFAKLVEMLLSRDAAPTQFDFFYGDQEWKRGLANRFWDEGSYVLVPRWSSDLPVVLAAVAGERLTEMVAARLARWGIKERVRDVVHQLGAKLPARDAERP